MKHLSFLVATTSALLASLGPAAAEASTIVGGSDLLNAASTQQLTDWLGQGSLTLTNIFDKVEGQTSYDFHAAVDGKGSTFTVFEATSEASGNKYLVGGYDPQSWSSTQEYYYNVTNDDSERTGFIFNLTTDVKLAQDKTDEAGTYGDTGEFQTYNADYVGPAFGGGFDLAVGYNSYGANALLEDGSAFAYSYGKPYSKTILGEETGDSGIYFTVGQLEVFSVGPGSTIAAVPEPQTYALMLAGFAAMIVACIRRNRLSSFS